MKKYRIIVTRHLNGKTTVLENVEIESDKSVSEILCNDALWLCKKHSIDNTKAKLYELENGLEFWRGTI